MLLAERPAFPVPHSVHPLLTASFSGLQTFTQRIWSRSQSMGLSR